MSRSQRDRYLARINPILVAILAVVFLYSENVDESRITSVAIIFLWSLVGAVVFMSLVRLAVRDEAAASFISVSWLVLFFTYGYVFDLISGESIGGFVFGRFRYLIAVELIAALLTLVVAFRARNFCQRSTQNISVVLIFLIIFNLAGVGIFQLGSPSDARAEGTNVEDITFPTLEQDQLPDIYYIILDSYPRQDVLQQIYGFDNSEFINYLEANGFYIGTESRSNYMGTLLSLASSLNMDYLQKLIVPDVLDSTRVAVLQDLVHDNKAALLAKRMGYQFAFLRTNWLVTLGNPHADKELSRLDYPWGASGRLILQPVLGNEFGLVFTQSTILRNFVDVGIVALAADLYTDKIVRLPEIAELKAPTFTFAHFAPPHPPYLFDQDGSVRGFGFSVSSYLNKTAYIDQLIWVNKSMMQVVDRILEEDNGNSVIVIQSDHGSQFSDTGDVVSYGGDPSEVLAFERSGILNVIRLPDSCNSDSLYRSITPVNTFRLIYDQCLGTNFGLLEDNTYWSSYNRPYEFTPIENFLPQK